MPTNDLKSNLTTAYHQPGIGGDNVLAVSNFDLRRMTDMFTKAGQGSLRLIFETPVASVSVTSKSLDDTFKQICQWSRSVSRGSEINVRIEANDPKETMVPAAQLSGPAQGGFVMIRHVKAGYWPKVA